MEAAARDVQEAAARDVQQRAGCNPGAAKADGQAWWKLPRTLKARAEKFHTCGGPRRRPGLGEGRGRRIYDNT